MPQKIIRWACLKCGAEYPTGSKAYNCEQVHNRAGIRRSMEDHGVKAWDIPRVPSPKERREQAGGE